jgi:hypothetical protein
VAPEVDPRLRLIAECLDRHGVAYVVIGGVAAMLQDVPIPETIDVDIVPKRETKNLKALAHALVEMEARLRIPGDPDGVEVKLDGKTFRNVSMLTFITRFGPFDVLTLHRFGLQISVASIEDLIAMKRATGREKDAAHLDVLLQHPQAADRKPK